MARVDDEARLKSFGIDVPPICSSENVGLLAELSRKAPFVEGGKLASEAAEILQADARVRLASEKRGEELIEEGKLSYAQIAIKHYLESI